jgi:hypothetical protein
MYVKIESKRLRYLQFNQKKAACGRFSKQLLDVGDGKVTTDEMRCIKLPTDFCTIIESQDTLIDQIFPNVLKQYTNYKWLAVRTILVVKNVHVNELNLKIQHLLLGDLVSYKFIDTVYDATEAVNYSRVFKLIGFTRKATA